MGLSQRFDHQVVEPRLQQRWQESGAYGFDPASPAPIYAIDTPPATVSGHLHMGHVYSYSHPDFIARFQRMRGHNVFYPMGYDDNGLPTERLVERRLGVTAAEVGRSAFVEQCLALSEELEHEYRTLWERLGLSVDWRYTYRTISAHARRIAQASFLDLYRQGLVYRSQSPTIWCPECGTAIAQAEVDDLNRESEFVTLPFHLDGGGCLPIATTRPELLPACVAVFVHPDDPRYQDLVGQQAEVPLVGLQVPVLADPAADPEKGTGAVMCCTFGDTADVAWWRTHNLPLRTVVDAAGHLTGAAGPLGGFAVAEGRQLMKEMLAEGGLILARQPVEQTVRVHERCDTPIEYLVTPQWNIRVLDFKDALLAAGDRIRWHPDHFRAQYRSWVKNLSWDWSISRQRTFGVPIPVWYCDACGQVVVAGEGQLPVDPSEEHPLEPCACGGVSFTPETDVFDTWATSSLSPQIAGRWLADDDLYGQIFPMSLRPQAHEIIRTWAFYTIVKSLYHFDSLPWQDVLISGWGLAPQGTGKISKSRGGGPVAPLAAVQEYSADAVRYWAASTSPGKDSVISEEKMRAGKKLVTKLWNVARFAERFLEGYTPGASLPALSSADRWILSRTQRLIQAVTAAFQGYDYAAAKNEIEIFFWTELADNYVEMAKQRLYSPQDTGHEGALYTLHQILLAVLKLLAPILPHVTEEIYSGLFAAAQEAPSIHRAAWPRPNMRLLDEAAESLGATLVGVASAVRRYKSERQMSPGAQLAALYLWCRDAALAEGLQAAVEDIASVTRAQRVVIDEPAAHGVDDGLEYVLEDGSLSVGLLLQDLS